MKAITCLQDFHDNLFRLLAGKPQGTVALMPAGDLVWVQGGEVHGCTPTDTSDDYVYQWDESAMEDETLRMLNVWVTHPKFTTRK